MISTIKNFFARKNAAGSIGELLEFQRAIGRFEGDPYKFAQDIVDRSWNARQTSGGCAEEQLITTIALSLSWAVSKTEINDQNMEALLACLKTAIDEGRKEKYNMRDIDINSINMCDRIRSEAIRLIGQRAG
jgi:hypothetical protein